MRRPVSVKVVFLFFSLWVFFAFEPSRLCRHPSIRTLLVSDFRSVQVGRPHCSRCCHLIVDLGSHLFDRSWARTWSQSPELCGGTRLFGTNSTPLRLPLCGCSAMAHRLLLSPTTCVAGRPTSVPRQGRLVSWHSFLPARLASTPSGGDHCPAQRVRECSAHVAPSVSLGNGLLPC
jgi:hypothetical protein